MADILRNLKSLQFESVLLAQGPKLTCLRKHSHALAVTACAQVAYLASVMRDSRLIASNMNNMVSRANKDSTIFRIGIIGCGRIGRHLVNSLLTCAEIPPTYLSISTRRPELLADLKALGVSCMFDNATVTESVSLLLLCCLPSQLPVVTADIRNHLRPDTVVFSIVSATPIARLRQLLGSNNILRPDVATVLPSDDDQQNWDISIDIAMSLEVREMVEKTCPLSNNKHRSPVVTSDHFAALLVFAVLNSITAMRLTMQQKLCIINTLVLGHTRQNRLDTVLRAEDFQLDPMQRNSPLMLGDLYDLVSLAKSETTTLLDKRLTDHPTVRNAFVVRYCDVFQQHLNWVRTAGISSTRKHLDVVND